MTTLADLLTRFEDVIPQDDGALVHCPAHNDTSQSLRLSVSRTGKVMVKCRAHCHTEDVVAALGLTMRDLATMKPGPVTFEAATSTNTPASPAEVAALRVRLDGYIAAALDPTHPVREYARTRFGLSDDAFERLELGAATDLGGGLRLVVPFCDPDGVARGFQARALDPEATVRWIGPKSPDGASWSRTAWFAGGTGWDEVLVTEGPGDALTAAAAGYDSIAVRGAGLAANETVIDTVAGWVGDRVAVLCGDGDASGRRFSSDFAASLSDRGVRVKVVDLAEGEDLTSWRAADPDRFASELVRAVVAADELTPTSATLAARDADRYPLTDLGNARFIRDFVAGRGSGVKFSPEAGFFLLKDGVWRPDKLDRTRAHAQEAADLVAKIARQLSEAAGTDTNRVAEAKRWLRWSTYTQSMQGMNAALRELQALPDVAVDVNQFDRHEHLIAVQNGVVNLRTGELLPPDPSLLLTRRVGHDYDPDARAPRWEMFLDEVFPNHPDLPRYMQRLIGYGVTGSTAEQCFAVLHGTGANGKSVLTDTLSEVFRELTVTTPFSTFEDRGSGGIPNDLAALKGARLVMAAEGEQGRPMAEAVLKRVTGRDLIAARFMRREFFEFRPSFLLMLASNYRPNFRGQDEGLWRRVKLLPFERYFRPDERDHRLGDKLLEEAPGILAWAVRGAVAWYAGGLADPVTITGGTKEYRETSDALAGFLPGEFERDPNAPRIMGKTLFDAYLAWADEENLPPRERWTRRTFYSALEERGAVKRTDKRGTAFEGIRRARATRVVDDITEAEEEPKPGPIARTMSGPSLTDLEDQR